MLNEEELRDAGLLVFANKQDQPGAKGAGEISEALQLGELRDRNWSIVACSAMDGRGIDEGMDWLAVHAVFLVLSVTRKSIANGATANGEFGIMTYIANTYYIPICILRNHARVYNRRLQDT